MCHTGVHRPCFSARSRIAPPDLVQKSSMDWGQLAPSQINVEGLDDADFLVNDFRGVAVSAS